MKKPIKVLEIVNVGHCSVLGCIYAEYKDEVMRIQDFSWIIFVNPESFEETERQCNELKLDEFIIADRKTMFVKDLK